MSSNHHQLLAQHGPPFQHRRSIHLFPAAFVTIHSIPRHPRWVAAPNYHNGMAHGDVKPGQYCVGKGIANPCHVAPNQYGYNPSSNGPKKEKEMQVYTVLLPPSLLMRMCGQLVIKNVQCSDYSCPHFPYPHQAPWGEYLCSCRACLSEHASPIHIHSWI